MASPALCLLLNPLWPNRRPIQLYPPWSKGATPQPRQGLLEKMLLHHRRPQHRPAGCPPHWTCREHVCHTATEEPTVTDALAGDECKAKKPHKPPSAQRWPARLHRLLETEVIYARIAKLQKLLGWAKPPRPKSRTAVTWSCTSWRGSFGPRSPRNDFNDFFRAFLHCGRQV